MKDACGNASVGGLKITAKLLAEALHTLLDFIATSRFVNLQASGFFVTIFAKETGAF